MRFRRLARAAAWAAVLTTAVPAGAGAVRPPTPTPAANTQAGFEAMLAKFEREVGASAAALRKMRTERERLAGEVTRLKEETDALHRRLGRTPGVLQEVRLKSLLGELRRRLEAQSEMESRWNASRDEFEEKALSLLTLYNDRIEQEISSTAAFLDPAGSEKRLGALVDTTRKRSRLQDLLRLYGEGAGDLPAAGDWDPSTLPPTRDRESLEMTVRLLKDRRREVETRYEQSILREEEILKEIRLQDRMKEFMDDIERVRGDSAFPSGGPLRRDLEWYQGKDQTAQLRDRLLRLRRQREKDQFTLVRLDAYLEQMTHQLKDLRGGREARP
jgi:hypothetical protein